MYTRLVENPGSLYTGVNRVEGVEIKPCSITMGCFGDNLIKQGHGSGEGMFASSEQMANTSPKKVNISFVSQEIIRVRYALSGDIPINNTEMLAMNVDGISVKTSDTDDTVTVHLQDHTVVIDKKPFSLTIFDKNGKKKYASSKGEYNSFKPLDVFSLGTVSYGNQVIRLNPSADCYEYAYLPVLSDKSVCVESFDLDANEHIYGFGEHFTGLDKKYQTIDIWCEDALGPVTQRQYKPVPFFVSSNNYGIFVNDSAPMTFWVGNLSNIKTQLAVENDFLDYFIILGDSMKEVIANYCLLTGKPVLPPKWSFGFWLSKFSYRSQKEALSVAGQMKVHGIPFDVLHLDTHWFEQDWVCDLQFGKTNFPDPKAMIQFLHDEGVHISLWQMPYLDDRSILFNEALEKGYFPKNADGNPSLWKSQYGMTYGVLDLTNPDTVLWWIEKFRLLFEMGVDAIKTDFGEGAPANANYDNEQNGRSMHNLYPFIYNKLIFDVTSEYHKQPFVWARAAYAGSQRYPVHWGGDNSGYYEQMPPQLNGGLSFMMSGFSFWSQDIAGFGDNVQNTRLYIRWFLLGSFMSHVRLHGVGDREPFRFGREVEDIIKGILKLRYQLIPYIYSCA